MLYITIIMQMYESKNTHSEIDILFYRQTDRQVGRQTVNLTVPCQ